jgi:hypothetical protein
MAERSDGGTCLRRSLEKSRRNASGASARRRLTAGERNLSSGRGHNLRLVDLRGVARRAAHAAEAAQDAVLACHLHGLAIGAR